ncbi:MAG: hypothetical protein NUV75_13250 [Gallionella sp.]|nr:hypothetical protein [Gallionella sp.]
MFAFEQDCKIKPPILNRHGKLIKTIELDYTKNVMADMKWTNEWLRDADEPNREFIFLVDK